jgi:hypothetical protein
VVPVVHARIWKLFKKTGTLLKLISYQLAVLVNRGDGSTLVSAMAKECKKVEVIEGFQPDEKMMKRSSFLRCFDWADNIDALSNRNREGRA